MTADLVNLTDLTGISPGVHLRSEIERLGFDQCQVASETGVSRQTINNIVNDRQPISRAMAAKLGRLTGRSSDYWLRSRFPNPDPHRKTFVGDAAGTSESSFAEEDAPQQAGVPLLVNRQIIQTVQQGIIVIDPFSPNNVQRASIDLTLDDFVIATTGEMLDISDGQAYDLGSGQTVNVSTREWIELPLQYIGRVGPMARLAKFGIIVSHGFQVDPGYRGHLQFCVFNAGGSPFRLHSGHPIISLEVMRLSAVPSVEGSASSEVPSPGNRDDVVRHFRVSTHRICDRLIRDFLQTRLTIDTAPDRVAAQISKLELELVNTTVKAATDAVIESSLETLRTIRAASKAEFELSRKYREFFDSVADELCLTADHAQAAVSALGLRSVGQENDVILRDGEKTLLQLPRESSKITLRNLARQLHEDPHDLILVLTSRHADEEDAKSLFRRSSRTATERGK